MAEIPDELARQLAAALTASAGDGAAVVVQEAPEPTTPEQISAAGDAAVVVIEAQADAEVRTIAAAAEADAVREAAHAEAVEQVAEVTDAAAAPEPRNDDVPPRSDHWYTRPLFGSGGA